MEVFAPDFPIGEAQSLGSWLAAFGKYADWIDDQTIMVGHSLGPAFILDFLESQDSRIAACFLVAPFAEPISINGHEDIEKANKTFVDKTFDWDKIRRNCGRFYVYASDDDPYVPLEESKLVATKTRAAFTLVPGAKHMNEDSGYLKFDKLLADIKAATGTQ